MPEGKEFEVVGDIQKVIEAEKAESKAAEVEKAEASSIEAKSNSTNGKASNGSGNEVQGKLSYKLQNVFNLLKNPYLITLKATNIYKVLFFFSCIYLSFKRLVMFI